MSTLAIAAVLSLVSAEAMRVVGKWTLARKQAAWGATQLTNYVYRYRAQCFCFGGGVLYRVEVRNGKVASAVALEPTAPLYDWQRVEREHPTVDSLFQWAFRAYAERAQKVRVRYDPTYHYPVELLIDGSYMVVDDELTVTAGDLAPSPRLPVARR